MQGRAELIVQREHGRHKRGYAGLSCAPCLGYLGPGPIAKLDAGIAGLSIRRLCVFYIRQEPLFLFVHPELTSGRFSMS